MVYGANLVIYSCHVMDNSQVTTLIELAELITGDELDLALQ